ncbi:MAG: hypothetical protein GY725_12080 [bacterium]|nr:hypothetical protein [bacterium]
MGSELPSETRPRIYLAPLESRMDARVIRASLAAAGEAFPKWIPSNRVTTASKGLKDSFLAGDPVLVPLSPPRTGPDRLARLLAWAARENREVDLIPIETLWGPANHSASLWNLPLGNPYDPPEWSRWIHVRRKGRVRVIIGSPGTRTALEGEVQQPGDTLLLSAYVRQQAVKALSVTQRQVFGDHYKVPRLLVEQIMGQVEFQDRVAAAGASAGMTREESLKLAERGLRELDTRHNRYFMEIFRRFTGWVLGMAYDSEICVDPEQLEKLHKYGRESALLFIPSHKSNFDHLTLYNLLFSSGFPPPHTAAGINMSFFPMSYILPGTGAYFIRRSFQDDPIYKECLRGFIHYLVQRRFHQEFFIEGGRTRSGKLLPPRYGMLNYIVDGVRKNDVDEVRIVPTAINYDEILEVGEYVRQQLGDAKEAESFWFLVKMIHAARWNKLGRVYVRFAEPISLREHLERSGDDALVVEKLAFQISNQINATMQMTAVSIACSVLLGAGRRALTRSQFIERTQRVLDYAEARGIAVTDEVNSGAEATVEAAVKALDGKSVIECYLDGNEPVYFVAESGHNAASYYRNTVIHFFLLRALASLSEEAAKHGDDIESWALRLRALLKFEFFFSERDVFRQEVAFELELIQRDREAGKPPFGAAGPRILLDFLESYQVVTETLRTCSDPDTPISEADLLRRCQTIGRQLLLQDRVQAPELLSNINFKNALHLIVNQGAAEKTKAGYIPNRPAELEVLAKDLDHLTSVSRWF